MILAKVITVPISDTGNAKCCVYPGFDFVDIEVQIGKMPVYVRTVIRLDTAAAEAWIGMLTEALRVLKETDHA